MIDGEPLPAPEPRRSSTAPTCSSHIDPFNPFVIFAVFVVGGILRSMLGRLIGSVATGGVVGAAGLVYRRLAGRRRCIAGVIAFVVTMFGDSIAAASGRGGGSGWSGG